MELSASGELQGLYGNGNMAESPPVRYPAFAVRLSGWPSWPTPGHSTRPCHAQQWYECTIVLQLPADLCALAGQAGASTYCISAPSRAYEMIAAAGRDSRQACWLT